MLNSMYSGISGLGANQKKLDVIGNNVANSGTTSFKSSSVTFQDSMYQSYKGASGPGLNLGGVNPSRVGMGVSIQSIVTNMAQGSLQPTGRPYDVAVDGTGYFIVAKGPEGGQITVNADQSMTSTTLESFYTRDGESASLNAKQNELVPLKIPEVVMKEGKEVRIQGFSIENDGLIKAVLADGSTTVLGQVAMASFTNNEGLEQKGNNMYSPSANSGDPLARVGKYEKGKALPDGRIDNGKAYGQILNGFLEMSNVDLSAQFTDMIVATRSFQACGKIITTADEILQELVNLKR